MTRAPEKTPVVRSASAAAPAVRWLRRNVELSSLLFLAFVVVVVWAFAELADEAGFMIVENFTDSRRYFVDSLWRLA